MGTDARSLPSASTRPALGARRPAIVRSSVDFPDPLGPSSAMRSPLSTARSTPWTMRFVPRGRRYTLSSSSLIGGSCGRARAPRRARPSRRARRAPRRARRPARRCRRRGGRGTGTPRPGASARRRVRERPSPRTRRARPRRRALPAAASARPSSGRWTVRLTTDGLAPSVAAASPRRGSRLRSGGTSARTTNGSATSACASGTIAREPRRSSGGASNARRKPKPSIAADAPSGSITSTPSVSPPRAIAIAAGVPTASAIAVATVA